MKCKIFDYAAFGPQQAIKTTAAELGSQSLENAIAHIHRGRSALRKAVVLDVSNCIDAFTDWSGRGGTLSDDLRKCTPPWPNVFVCAKSVGGEVGVHCVTEEITGEIKRFIDEADIRYRPGKFTDRALANGTMPNCRDAVWQTLNTVWYRSDHSRALGVECCGRLTLLNADGRVLGSIFTGQPPKDSHFALAFFAFQLAHCRNVSTGSPLEHRPQMPKGRRNESPRITYHVLSITDTIVKRQGEESSGEYPGVPKHIVRGNFAHYTEEAPLFGKFTGTFWRPMHIRGEAKHGIVGKEYAIEEPQAGEPATT